MYQIFKSYPMIREHLLDTPDFEPIRKKIISNTDKIVEYYRNSGFVVNNNHLLIQILNQLNVSLQRDLPSYVNVANFESERIARAFRLVHPDVSDPIVRYGEFYHKQLAEFIVVNEELFDYELAYKKWKVLAPIKIHYHPFTDMNSSLLTGSYRTNNNERGYAVISINIAMLALQYKAWMEKENTGEESNLQKKIHFLFKYPLLNCIHRHLEIALINRTCAKMNGENVAPFYRVHPCPVINYIDQLDNYIDKRISYMKRAPLRFDEFFSGFSGIRRKDWYNIIKPINVAPNRNTKWLLELSTIHYLKYYLEYRKLHDYKPQFKESNRLKRDLVRLENDSIYYKGSNSQLNNLFSDVKILLDN